MPVRWADAVHPHRYRLPNRDGNTGACNPCHGDLVGVFHSYRYS